ncbi:TPA: glycosyltransferase family 4 protein [Bacillus cereus]|nr:glycosyltransferase family 4 protein [Bacillus cereus]
MNLKHICFVAEGYPTADDPTFTFVRQLIVSIADQGIKCSVIVPQSITNSLVRGKGKRPFHWVDTTKGNSKIDIYQPRYMSLSNLSIKNMSLTHFLWSRAVINVFQKEGLNPDVVYGHFWHSGLVAAIIGEKQRLPVFVASGESRITVRELYREKILSQYLPKIKGVICVSTKNMFESIDLNLANQSKIAVIPNAIDGNRFYFENKLDVRKKLGFNEEDFIVAFTGTFNNRKGALRLAEAIKKVGNVKSIFIGSGEQTPEIDGILFCGKLPHDQIVHYLNAADVFVLPTLAEGCSNAIIEAMACGLPIISSDLPFNDDILDAENSIRVNSLDVESIAEAIRFLREHPAKRKSMSKSSLAKASELNIETRAKRVIQYIEEQSGVR